MADQRIGQFAGSDMIAAINEIAATTAHRREIDDAAIVSRTDQAIAICRGFAARVPVSVMTSITGLTPGRIFQIRREAFGLLEDAAGHHDEADVLDITAGDDSDDAEP